MISSYIDHIAAQFMLLKDCGGMNESRLRVICSSVQSLAVENWNERQPKEVWALGTTSVIHLPGVSTGSGDVEE